MLQHGHTVRTAAFSGDGARVATGSHDHTARVWDAEDGRPLTRPLEHQGPVLHVAFVDQLPRNALGKVLKTEIRKQHGAPDND